MVGVWLHGCLFSPRAAWPAALCALLLAPLAAGASVVISEIHYNPPDDGLEAGSYREFVELRNAGDASANLEGYRFTDGIRFEFGADAVLEPGERLVVARVPTHAAWRRFGGTLLGPYEGKLADSGETLELAAPDGTVVDRFAYGDAAPWPQGPDGYGPSLERIAPGLPADDPHSWRASLTDEGTPGAANSVEGIPPYPQIRSHTFIPPQPGPEDETRARIEFDSGPLIASAALRWEIAGLPASRGRIEMNRLADVGGNAVFEAVIPPQPSQSLIHCAADVVLTDGATVRLPHESEPAPVWSYFVYGGELRSELPILWVLFPGAPSSLTRLRPPTGAVALPLGQDRPDAFGCAQVRASHNGHKIRFIKGREFYGDRTVNLIPQTPVRGTNPGGSAPFREHLGFWFYREMGVLSPWARFYRVITLQVTDPPKHEQRLVIQQVNENFLAMNGRDPDGDLFKRVYSNPNWEKHTNKDDGTSSVHELERALRTNDTASRREVMERHIGLDAFLRYSAASVLTSNWDGFWNNHWMYLPPGPGARWDIIPWDLDWLWGSTTKGIYSTMPLRFPIDGVATGGLEASRNPGPITAPMHQDPQFYEDYLMAMRHGFDGMFTREKLYAKMDDTEAKLTGDLQLMEQITQTPQRERLMLIRSSHRDIKTFIEERIEYLEGVLPAGADDWALH